MDIGQFRRRKFWGDQDIFRVSFSFWILMMFTKPSFKCPILLICPSEMYPRRVFFRFADGEIWCCFLLAGLVFEIYCFFTEDLPDGCTGTFFFLQIVFLKYSFDWDRSRVLHKIYLTWWSGVVFELLFLFLLKIYLIRSGLVFEKSVFFAEDLPDRNPVLCVLHFSDQILQLQLIN